jgi:hypothetical protein
MFCILYTSETAMQTQMELGELGASITRAASLQTYATVRLLVDRDRVEDAYEAYAYFRWVDDWLDAPARQKSDRLAFVRRQASLIDSCYQGHAIQAAAPQEEMLVALVNRDGDGHSGLQSYIHNMMAVMAFDAERRGRLISQRELAGYEQALSMAVTEALHYFIGHGSYSPHGATRYLAAEGAHITHMLRDTLEDNEVGYFNIPCEILKANGISPFDTDSQVYRSWVRSRVRLARDYFRAGRIYLAHVQSLRCRLAGFAYIARFEAVLNLMERDGYLLRPEYREAKGPKAGAQMGWSVVWSAFKDRAVSRRAGQPVNQTI